MKEDQCTSNVKRFPITLFYINMPKTTVTRFRTADAMTSRLRDQSSTLTDNSTLHPVPALHEEGDEEGDVAEDGENEDVGTTTVH